MFLLLLDEGIVVGGDGGHSTGIPLRGEDDDGDDDKCITIIQYDVDDVFCYTNKFGLLYDVT